jgi:hypothetical protein
MTPVTASRRPPWVRVAVALLVLVAVTAGLAATQASRIRDAAEAYLYGIPLVMMDLTRTHAARTLGPENALRRVRQFPEASFKGVVRPNVDTLYTTAFIDMAQGPWVFRMAAHDERYAVMPFMDAWTNVYASPGTRTTGTAAAAFVLAGPGWQGTVPVDMTLLRSPTRIVWLIGRTQTQGAADYPRVHRLQDGLSLEPLAGRSVDTAAAWQPAAPPPVPPVQQLRALSTEAFYTRLGMLMVDNPPLPDDAPMVARLRAMGVTPGQPLQWGLLDGGAASLGRWLAELGVARALKQPGNLVRGWSTPPANLGRYGTDYATRAAVALVGLGANLPEDAMYPSAQVDAQGQTLDGSRRYRIHFTADALPPVQAFWSITAYGADDFLIDNPLHRHALGDRDPLVFQPDGSLDLWIQADPPSSRQQANWLPVKAGQPFLLTARLYRPLPSALNGTWGMPTIERLEEPKP